jgi:hypothetical protein
VRNRLKFCNGVRVRWCERTHRRFAKHWSIGFVISIAYNAALVQMTCHCAASWSFSLTSAGSGGKTVQSADSTHTKVSTATYILADASSDRYSLAVTNESETENAVGLLMRNVNRNLWHTTLLRGSQAIAIRPWNVQWKRGLRVRIYSGR